MPELSGKLEDVRNRLDEEKKKKLQRWKKDLIDTIKHEGEDVVAEQLKDEHILKLVDDDFFDQMYALTGKEIVRSYLETNRDRIRDEIPSSTKDSFDIDMYKDLNKTELAKEMARHAVNSKRIIPVDYGGIEHQETMFYRYEWDTGLYKPFSDNKMRTLASKMAEDHDTKHVENEFMRNMRNSQVRKKMKDMGMDAYHILLDNKKVLKIHNPEDPEIIDVKPDHYAIHKLNTHYEPSADCPNFKQFINHLFDGDEKSIKTSQEFLGYLLKYPDKTFQKALLILGESNTGKSQLTEVVEELFYEYSVSNLSAKMIGMDRSFHVSRLQGRVVNIDRDMASQHIDRPDIFKQVVSQERLTVEEKGSDSFPVNPRAKHIICSNVSPRIENANDDGFYTRFITLKAPNIVDKSDRVPNLGKKLYEEEAPGILNWMLEGLQRLEEQGEFTYMPEAYETKTLWNEYGNSAQKFVWYKLEATGSNDDFVSTQLLYQHYETWMQERLENKVSKSEFSRVLNETQLFTKRNGLENGKQKRGYAGVRVVDD